MESGTQQETKKQHYVPRCYLRRWGDAKGRVFVFDKASKTQRRGNIYDIACQRYFYDVEPSELWKIRGKCLQELGIDPGNNKQFVERFLSKHVDGLFADLLSRIASEVDSITPRSADIHLLSVTDRAELSICMAFQYVRTSFVRYGIMDNANCVMQVLRDMEVPQEMIDKYAVDQDDARVIHDGMVLDIQEIEKLAHKFNDLTWVLCVNQMGMPFYTSDCPIITRAHVDHPFLSMAGIASKGVEVAFPLSPQCILVMVDGAYHRGIVPLNNKYYILEHKENIEYYNSLMVSGSDRIIISSDGDFDVVKRMLEKEPTILSQPRVEMSWGGRKYHAMSSKTREEAIPSATDENGAAKNGEETQCLQ